MSQCNWKTEILKITRGKNNENRMRPYTTRKTINYHELGHRYHLLIHFFLFKIGIRIMATNAL